MGSRWLREAKRKRSVMAEWSKLVAFKAGVSQRRFESGRRQTVTVATCTLWQGSLNLSATSPMTISDAETDVKLYIFYFLFFCPGLRVGEKVEFTVLEV